MPSRTMKFTYGLIGITALFMISGCTNESQNGNAIHFAEETPKSIAGGLDPTGGIQEIQDRRTLWRRIDQTFKNFDVQGLNDAMGQMYDLMEALSVRIKVWQENDLAQLRDNTNATLEAVRTQVDGAKFDDLIQDFHAQMDEFFTHVDDLLSQLNSQAAELNPAELNAIMTDTRSLLEKLQETQTRLDEQITPLLSEVRLLAEDSRKSLGELPMDSLDDALSSIAKSSVLWPEVSASLLSTSETLRTAALIAITVLLLAGLSVILRLIHFLRDRSKQK